MTSTPDDDLPARIRRALELPDAPRTAIDAAIGLWTGRSPRPMVAAVQAVLAQVAGVLSFDSWAVSPLAAGVRGAGGEVRHLLFTASGRDVDVRIAPEAGGYRVAGQVLGPDEEGLVELTDASSADIASGPVTLQTSLDALGAFRLEYVTPGRYVMKLRLGTEVILLPAIDIGPREA